MTSQIVSSTIDADYPVAGQDNDSQGFRDNFSIIKDGLATGAAEITVLETNTAKLNEDNDFQGNVIANAQTNRLYGTVYNTSSTPTTNVSLNDGEYQAITLIGNATLTFVDWPEIDRYAKIRLALKSNGTQQTITFASEGGGVVRKEVTEAVAEATSVYRKASPVATIAPAFSFETRNLTRGAFQAGDLLFGTGLIGSVTASSVTSLTNVATETVAPYSIGYSGINGLAFVTTTTSPGSIGNGEPVKFSDTTGIALTAGTTYYAYGRTGAGFYISDTLTGATAASKIPAANLSGTINVTEITVSGTDTIVTATGVSSAFQAGTAVTLTLVDYPAVTFDAAYTAGPSYTFFAYGISATGGTIIFKLAGSYAGAVAGTPITAPTGAFTGLVANVPWFGTFSGSATARFPEFETANSIVVGNTTGFFVGMPIKFTNNTIGGIVAGTQYYVTELVSSTALRISTSIGGTPIEVTTSGVSIASVTVSPVGNNSTGYSTGNAVTFSAPTLVGGITATGTIVADGTGKITGINVTNVGSGYTSVPTVTASTGTIGTTALIAVLATMPIEPTTTIEASLPASSSQVITGSSSVVLSASKAVFPTPFTVSSDVNKIKIVEAWTSDGGTNIFIKYLGEYA